MHCMREGCNHIPLCGKTILGVKMKILSLLILVLLVFGCTSTSEGIPQPDVTPEASAGGIAFSEFAEHNSAEDCWVLYRGEVYDITSWLPNHPPGADKIAFHCGKTTFDDAFTIQHGDTKTGTLKSEGVLIGNLID